MPKLRRLPVRRSFLREYKRYSPDLSLRIIEIRMPEPKQALPRPIGIRTGNQDGANRDSDYDFRNFQFAFAEG